MQLHSGISELSVGQVWDENFIHVSATTEPLPCHFQEIVGIDRQAEERAVITGGVRRFESRRYRHLLIGECNRQMGHPRPALAGRMIF